VCVCVFACSPLRPERTRRVTQSFRHLFATIANCARDTPITTFKPHPRDTLARTLAIHTSPRARRSTRTNPRRSSTASSRARLSRSPRSPHPASHRTPAATRPTLAHHRHTSRTCPRTPHARDPRPQPCAEEASVTHRQHSMRPLRSHHSARAGAIRGRIAR